jgi:hypothetical protein
MANSISEPSGVLLALSQTGEAPTEAGYLITAKSLTTDMRRRERTARTDRVIVAAKLEGRSRAASEAKRFVRSMTALAVPIEPLPFADPRASNNFVIPSKPEAVGFETKENYHVCY